MNNLSQGIAGGGGNGEGGKRRDNFFISESSYSRAN